MDTPAVGPFPLAGLAPAPTSPAAAPSGNRKVGDGEIKTSVLLPSAAEPGHLGPLHLRRHAPTYAPLQPGLGALGPQEALSLAGPRSDSESRGSAEIPLGWVAPQSSISLQPTWPSSLVWPGDRWPLALPGSDSRWTGSAGGGLRARWHQQAGEVPSSGESHSRKVTSLTQGRMGGWTCRGHGAHALALGVASAGNCGFLGSLWSFSRPQFPHL